MIKFLECVEQLGGTGGFRAGKLVLAGQVGRLRGGAELSFADSKWVVRAESGVPGGRGWSFSWDPESPCGRNKLTIPQVVLPRIRGGKPFTCYLWNDLSSPVCTD